MTRIMRRLMAIVMVLVMVLVLSDFQARGDGLKDYSLGTALSEGQFNPTTPEVHAMLKYGGRADANLYTGAATFGIELYTYKDRDFTIPITLRYTSDGFKPNAGQGVTGLGWSLCVGGMITREVRGIPDEARGRIYSYRDKGDGSLDNVYNIAAAAQADGLMMKAMLNAYNNMTTESVDGYGSRVADNPDLTSPDYVYSGELGKEYFLVQNGGMRHRNYEMEPDIYHYSFMGYNGSFTFREDGNVTILNSNTPPGELKVRYNYNASSYWLTSFEIETGDGYVYTFGKTDSIHSFSDRSDTDDSDNDSVSAWNLTEMRARTGVRATFSYDGPVVHSLSMSKSINTDHITLTDAQGRSREILR